MPSDPGFTARVAPPRATPLLASWFAVLLLAGCESLSPPDLRNPAPLPVEWRQAGDFRSSSPDRDLTRWWTSFSDPQLTRLIREGLASSPDTASAAARVREARANRTATASALFPTLSGGTGSNTRSTKRRGGGTDTGTSYSADLSASWEADIYGRNRNNLLAADYDARSAEETFHSVQASLAAEVATAYISLLANQSRLEVLQRNLAAQQETTQLAIWRRDAGEADTLESSRAEASLEQARGNIPQVQQAIIQNQNLLARLCGRQPGAINLSPAKSGKIPVPATRLAIGIPADTIRQRPDVRRASYQLLAATARNKSVRATQFPSLTLSGSLGINALTTSKLFRPDTLGAAVISNFSGPLFDAGRIRANIAASDAVIDQSLEAYRFTVLTALSEVEDALTACKKSAERLASIEKATSFAREADLLARQQYEAGETDFTTVVDSQRTLLSLEDSLIATQTDHSTAYVRLYQALGGGWSPQI